MFRDMLHRFVGTVAAGALPEDPAPSADPSAASPRAAADALMRAIPPGAVVFHSCAGEVLQVVWRDAASRDRLRDGIEARWRRARPGGRVRHRLRGEYLDSL